MNDYVISNYAKIIRKYACYRSDEECLNDLVNLIADPLKIEDREGEPYSLTKGDVSDIMNRKENVPKVIKEGAIKVDFQSVADGFEDILLKISEDKVPSLVKEIQALYSNKNDSNYSLAIEKSFNKYIKKPNVFLTNTFLQCLSYENKINYEKIYYEKGNGKLSINAGDILKISFNQKEIENEKIVVIPVDADFTMKVEGLDDKENKLISPNSIHGKWLKKMKILNKNTESYIDSYIEQHKILKQKGSIIPLKLNNTLFYLLAISKLDENNNAHCNKEELKKAIVSLLDYYDKNGQGYPMFIPLLGTGLSRTGLTHKESIELIKDTCMDNTDKINGEITIIVYRNDIKKMKEN